MAWWLTSNAAYAASARTQILELTTTSGYGMPTYSGANQCILNLSREMLPFITAADLLEDYSGWSTADKTSFQTWLATVVYGLIDYANDAQGHNWGASGSDAALYISDYLICPAVRYTGACPATPVLMVDRFGATINSTNAFAEAKQRALDRMDGNRYMTNVEFLCQNPTTLANPDWGSGIKPNGSIPWELYRRNNTWDTCDELFVSEALTTGLCTGHDCTYMTTHITPLVMEAELLWRRGDDTLYTHIVPLNATNQGAGGSVVSAIYFIIHNPTGNSVQWDHVVNCTLEPVYRFFAETVNGGTLDPYIGPQLGIGGSIFGSRQICPTNNKNAEFLTMTHGFAVGEIPTPPPVTPAP